MYVKSRLCTVLLVKLYTRESWVEVTSCHLRMQFSSKWTPSFSTITGNGSLSTWCMSVKASIAYLTSFYIFLAFGADVVTAWNEGIIKKDDGLGCKMTLPLNKIQVKMSFCANPPKGDCITLNFILVTAVM